MVLLSDFLRFRLADQRGRVGRLVDVGIDLATGDYPPVDRVLIRVHRKQLCTLAWDQVDSLDWSHRRVVVHDLAAAEAAPAEALIGLVLARRDVMDALIVDVARRHALRANDLWFREL